VSVENKTYTETEVPLNFAVDENTSRVVYSLDGSDNVTIVGNATLTALSVGTHTLTIYAWDEAGNVASQTASFTVVDMASRASGPSELYLPTLIIFASASLTASLAVGLIVRFKRRKREAKRS
jgi:hypothetical protein